MPIRRKRPRDTNQLAHQIVCEATGQIPAEQEQPDTRNPHALALNRLGASKGGQARAKSLSKARRAEIAKRAAAARWRGRKS